MQRVLALLCAAGSAAIVLAIARVLVEPDREPVRVRPPAPAVTPIPDEEPPAEFPIFPYLPERQPLVSDAEARGLLRIGTDLFAAGDFWAAVEYLAAAHASLDDPHIACVTLASAYYQLNLIRDAHELVPCLDERVRRGDPAARQLLLKLERSADVELGFASATSDHFIASFPSRGVAARSVGLLLELLEAARSYVERRGGFSSMRLIPVVLYDRRDLRHATTAPDWSSALFDGKIRVSVHLLDRPRDHLRGVLTHEYVHALTREMTGRRLPAWMREGLAKWFSEKRPPPDTRRRLLDAPGDLIGFEDLRRSFEHLPAHRVAHAYRQSHLMTLDLIDEWGWPRLADLLLDLEEDPALSFERAFRGRFGESPRAYLDRWAGGDGGRG